MPDVRYIISSRRRSVSGLFVCRAAVLPVLVQPFKPTYKQTGDVCLSFLVSFGTTGTVE